MTCASHHCFTLFGADGHRGPDRHLRPRHCLLPPYSEARQHQRSTAVLDISRVPCMIHHHAAPSDALENIAGALRSLHGSLSAYRSDCLVCALNRVHHRRCSITEAYLSLHRSNMVYMCMTS
jgi:hypothetical protein